MGTENQAAHTKRLIVLAPDRGLTNLRLAYQVYKLATREGRNVLFLVLLSRDTHRLEVSRELATLKAVTAGNHLEVESIQVRAKDWEKCLRETIRPGDKLVCLAGQRVNEGLFSTIDLEDAIAVRLGLPVTLITGLELPPSERLPKWAHTVLTYAGFLAIILMFSWLEVRLRADVPGAAGILLLILVFCLEGGAFSVWNSITYR